VRIGPYGGFAANPQFTLYFGQIILAQALLLYEDLTGEGAPDDP